MDIFAVLDQVRERLQQKGRMTYRILKMQFQLDDEQLDVLKDELIKAEQVARDEAGEVLVWAGERSVGSSQHSVVSSEEEDKQRLQVTTPQSSAPKPQPPSSYTPPHLAERIRAEQSTMEARDS